jgi:hypothetical protein
MISSLGDHPKLVINSIRDEELESMPLNPAERFSWRPTSHNQREHPRDDLALRVSCTPY